MRVLSRQLFEKPWGRLNIAPEFGIVNSSKVGEIWHESNALPTRLSNILIKHLFTSDFLSVQVHPDDCYAKAHGCVGGKNECWFITDVQPDAVLGIGLNRAVDGATLAQSARDGSIIDLMTWHRPRPNQCWYIPAGTIHAIGPGISLIEVQQSNDITYRLYDYGRDRPLHIDSAIAVASAAPYPLSNCIELSANTTHLTDNPYFEIIYLTPSITDGTSQAIKDDCLIVPISGDLIIEGQSIKTGRVAMVGAGEEIRLSADASALMILSNTQVH